MSVQGISNANQVAQKTSFKAKNGAPITSQEPPKKKSALGILAALAVAGGITYAVVKGKGKKAVEIAKDAFVEQGGKIEKGVAKLNDEVFTGKIAKTLKDGGKHVTEYNNGLTKQITKFDSDGAVVKTFEHVRGDDGVLNKIVKKAGDKTETLVRGENGKFAKEIIEEVKEKAAQVVDAGKNATKKAAGEVKEKAAQVVDDGKKVAGEVKEKAAQVVDDGKNAAKKVKKQATEQVEQTLRQKQAALEKGIDKRIKRVSTNDNKLTAVNKEIRAKLEARPYNKMNNQQKNVIDGLKKQQSELKAALKKDRDTLNRIKPQLQEVNKKIGLEDISNKIASNNKALADTNGRLAKYAGVSDKKLAGKAKGLEQKIANTGKHSQNASEVRELKNELGAIRTVLSKRNQNAKLAQQLAG